MGLKDLLSRFGKSRDDAAIERAERETQMTAHERDVDQEDFEARKDDAYIDRSFAGSEAERAADDDLGAV